MSSCITQFHALTMHSEIKQTPVQTSRYSDRLHALGKWRAGTPGVQGYSQISSNFQTCLSYNLI